jgi:hypothetical protein
MEEFTFATSLNINMGYCYIQIDSDAQKLCTILFPWYMGKYKYKRLNIGKKTAWFLIVE